MFGLYISVTWISKTCSVTWLTHGLYVLCYSLCIVCITVMNYTVEADVLPHSSQTRVRFDANDKNVYTGSLSMTKQHCESQTLKVIVRAMHTT